jgi:hypothetical protein
MWINRTNRRGPTRQSSCDSRTSGKKGRGIFVAFSQLRELGEQAVALGLLAEAERLYGPRDATYRFARVTLDPKGPNLRFSPTWDEICIELSPSTITYPDQAWVERCGRPTTHGHTSPREAFPAPICVRTYLAGPRSISHECDWVFSAPKDQVGDLLQRLDAISKPRSEDCGSFVHGGGG